MGCDGIRRKQRDQARILRAFIPDFLQLPSYLSCEHHCYQIPGRMGGFGECLLHIFSNEPVHSFASDPPGVESSCPDTRKPRPRRKGRHIPFLVEDAQEGQPGYDRREPTPSRNKPLPQAYPSSVQAGEPGAEAESPTDAEARFWRAFRSYGDGLAVTASA